MFTGSIVALVTPMDNKGAIDRVSLKKLIEYHIVSGTAGIVSVGTTGESATLSYHEHIDVVLHTLELTDGRIPVIAGTGSNNTAKAICLTHCFANTGVSGCLTVTPYYNSPTQEGLYQHFRAIAESTSLPQILYNIPSRTGCDLLPSTIAKLAKINNIVAIKEATGKLNRISQIQEQVDNKDFILLSGNDVSGLDFIRLGGKGIISVTANVAAPDMANLCTLALEGNFVKAKHLNKRLMLLHQSLFLETNPIPVKWACKALGLMATDTLRLPMTPLSNASRSIVQCALKRTGLL
ncbi:4-hydroxy-tetrahydrodipicolinate synthase [Candidatus Gillettellia adelgis]